ncbi:MAG: hypothetical protein QOI87_3646 [Bradyrhizobium sp.]|nr:hypothetical protein [Bradyrhizobium sp.]
MGLAGARLRTVDVIDHGEIGRVRAVGDRDPHGCGPGIVGETDMKLGLPGQLRDLDRGLADGDAGRWPGNNSPRANAAAAQRLMVGET